jgi:hypothetical protein
MLKTSEKGLVCKPLLKTARQLRAIDYSLAKYDAYATCVMGSTFKKIILIFFLTNLLILRQGGLGEIFQVKICFRHFVFEILAKSQKLYHFVCLKPQKKA